MFEFLGRVAVAHPWKVCGGWLLVAVVLAATAPSWRQQAQDDDIHFLPAGCACVRAHDLMARAFPEDVCASRAVFALTRGGGALSAADLAAAGRVGRRFQRLRADEPALKVAAVATHLDPVVGNRLLSADRRCVLVGASLATTYLAVQTRDTVERLEAAAREELASAEPGLELHVTGPAGVGRDLIKASAESLDRTTLATVILIVVVLLAVYRAPLLALVPLVTIGVACWVALNVLAVATLIPGVQLVNVAQVFAVVILFGAGTDYCLFLISRYREQLEAGRPTASALSEGVRKVGGALAASAATVIVGLGMMGFASFGKVRCAGPVIAVGLVIAVAACLTLTPALLKLCGRSAFWPGAVVAAPAGRREGRLWAAVSGFVVRRPVLVWCLALVPLVPLAALGLRVRPTFNPTGDLGPRAASVRGMEVVAKHFTAGEAAPLTVLVTADLDWDEKGRDAVRFLSRGLAFLPNVAEVRSLTQPLGVNVPDAAGPAGGTGWSGLWSGVRSRGLGALGEQAGAAVEREKRSRARAHYVRDSGGEPGRPRQVTRLDVVLRSDPFSDESVRTLEQVETWVAGVVRQRNELASGRAEVFGMTVYSRDLAEVIGGDRLLVNALVLAGVFVILWVLVRRVWLAGYLLGTVVISYYATLGLTAVFAAYYGGQPFGHVEWRVPFFLFIILVAVGEDYNILLVTRILQERKRSGLKEGVRRGLAATGGPITACGLIMAGTFATLMLAELGTLVVIGFALAAGVILDTFLIRPFLVPSFMLIAEEEAEVPDPRGLVVRPVAAACPMIRRAA